MLPFLPLLPAARNEPATRGQIANYTPFSTFADELVCLTCASPFNADCGYWNFSLRSDSETGHYIINTLPCMCSHCDEHVELSNGGADGLVADRRARLAQRHNFRLLDTMLGVDEPVEAQRRFVKNRVPVLELRAMLLGDEPELPDIALAGYDRHAELPALLCSFSRTVAYVQSDAGKRLLERRVLTRVAELSTRYQIAVPPPVLRRPDECLLMCALLLRVVCAYDLMQATTEDLRSGFKTDPTVQWFVLQAQMFADTHIDLHLNCDVFEQYRDEQLEAPLYKSMATGEMQRDGVVHEILGQSHLQRCYPHPLRAMWAGELASACEALALGDIWTKVSDSGKSMVSGFVHVFLCKASNHKCMVRNFSKILCETFGEYESMLPFIVNVLEVHKLGNFPGPRVRPRWRARLAVRRSHHMDRFEMFTWCAWCNHSKQVPCPMPGCDNRKPTSKDARHKKHLCDVCQFFSEVEPQLYVAVKEFYIFQVRCQRVVEAKQLLHSQWHAYREVALMAADDARRHVDMMYDAQSDLSPAALQEITDRMTDAVLLAQQCNKTVQRLRKDYRLSDLLLRMISHAHNKVVVCQQWTGCQRPEDFLLAPLLRNGEQFEDRRLERMNACFAPLEHLGGKRWCDVYTLAHVKAVAEVCLELGDIITQLLPSIGMSPGCHAAIQEMQCSSEMRNMPDNSFKDLFKKIYAAYPVDFHLLHYFLQCMHAHDMVYAQNLDADTTIAQAKALRLRYQVMPWQPLPEDVDAIYFCRGDRRIYTELVEGISADDVALMLGEDEEGDTLFTTFTPFARGVKGALYCHRSKQLYCTTDVSSTISRKFKRDGLFDQEEFFGSSRVEKRNARSVRTARETKKRCEAPLERIHFLGRAVRIGTRAYTLCVVCGAPCQYDGSRLTAMGPTCGRHHTFGEEGCYTDLRLYANRFLQQVRETTDGGGREGRLFPLPVPLLCAPPEVKHTCAPALKLGCIGTPLFGDGAFTTEENIVEWDGGGRNKAPTKAALSEFAIDRRASANDTAAKEAFAALDAAQPAAAIGPAGAVVKEQEEAAAAQAADEFSLSETTLQEFSRASIEAGIMQERVAIQCVMCYERCQRKERFVRVTVIDIGGVLINSLTRKPIGVCGPVDVWLCKNCMRYAGRLLHKSNAILAQDLYNCLKEAHRRSMANRLQFAQGVRGK